MKNMISKTDRDGLKTLFEYDALDQITKVAYADGKEVAYSYNPLRQLVEMRDWLGLTQIEPDALGRATKVVDHKGDVVEYSYNALGARESVKYPDGSVVKYGYDGVGQLTNVTDPNGGVARYAYDAVGRLTERVLPNGAATRYSFDPASRIKVMVNQTGDEILDRFNYSYDGVGNQTQVVKERQGIQTDNGVFNYSYDPLGRLIQAEHDGQSKTYSYDAAGNRVQSTQSGQTTNYAYNAANQLLRMDAPDISKEYEYDPRGNLAKVLANGTIDAQYLFDGTGMLSKAITSKGQSEYAYNGMGKRISSVIKQGDMNPAREINYLLDLTRPFNDLLQTTDNGKKQSYTWGLDVLSATSEDVSQYYLQDHLGSPIRLLDEQGETSQSLAYDEFGVPVIDPVAHADNPKGLHNPFGFTGYQRDEVSGLSFAQARWYDRTVGRFVSEDALRGSIDRPESLNRYGYCYGNPLKWIDVDGKTPVSPVALTNFGMQINAVTPNTLLDSLPRIQLPTSASLALAVTKGSSAPVIDLGGGWKARIEQHGTGAGFQKHVVIYKNGKQWAQNEDGSPHDKNNNSPGSPPNSVLKKLKEKEGWDWKQKDSDWLSKIEMNMDDGGMWHITYPDGSKVQVQNSFGFIIFLPPNAEALRSYYSESDCTDSQQGTTDTPFGPFILPMPIPVPIPIIPIPGPMQIPFPLPI